MIATISVIIPVVVLWAVLCMLCYNEGYKAGMNTIIELDKELNKDLNSFIVRLFNKKPTLTSIDGGKNEDAIKE